MRNFIGILLLAWSAWFARATDYYIDYANGTNSAAGTSTNTAWKHCPGDPNATGNAAAKVPAAGDRFLFRKGVTYSGQITITTSGTTNSPIQYDGNEWGTGTYSTNSADGQLSANFFLLSGARTFNQFRDFRPYRIGTRLPSDPVFSGAACSYGGNSGGAWLRGEGNPVGITVSNIFGEEIGYFNNVTQNMDGTVINGYLVRLRGGHSHRISSINGHNVSVVLSLQNGTTGMSNVLVNGVTIGTCRWGVDIAPSHNSMFAHMLFEDITVDPRIHEYDAPNWLGCPGGEEPHTDGMFFRAPSACSWLATNGIPTITVDGYKGFSDGVDGSGTAQIYISQGPSLTVRNSQLGPDEMGYGIGVGHGMNTSTQIVYIVNNTLFFDARINIQNSDTGGSSNIARRVHILNNILHSSISPASVYAINVEGWGDPLRMLGRVDYNLYYNSAVGTSWTPIRVKPAASGAQLYTFSGWQAKGYDQNSTFGNPLFTDLIAGSGETSDLHLLTNSPAIGAGTNLLSMVPSDFDGTFRTNVFDIGAFVFNAATGEDPDTDPPSPAPDWIQEPFVLNSHSIAMIWSASSDPSGVVYDVQEMTGNSGCASFSTTATGYTNSSIPFETICTYKVRARDGVGNATAYSLEESASTPAIAETFQFSALSATIMGNVIISEPSQENIFYLHAENNGTQPGWTDMGVATDWNYGSTVFAGVEAFNAGDTTNFSYTTVTFTATDELTVVGAVHRNSVSGTEREFGQLLVGGVRQASWGWSTNGLHINHGSAASLISRWSPANNWNTFRIKYKAGSGSDGWMSGEWHTNLTFSAGGLAVITNGTGQGSVDAFRFGHTNGLPGNRFVGDNIWGRVGTNSISGDDPTPGPIPGSDYSEPLELTSEGGVTITTEGGVIITTE